MKSTQNEKISQIKTWTLVVGIDVAKEIHYARAFDYRGIELGKLLKFSNTAEGFQKLEQWMQLYMPAAQQDGYYRRFRTHWTLLVYAGRLPKKPGP